ncbi:MAG: methyltransferase domain-containing protein [Patescibacteria group bacterium]|jgi:ubiquinone/menaquinone biosynthesis C-methylase UbiE
MEKQSQREVKKEQWKEMAKVWASYLPPAKPSKNEIKFWEKELKKLPIKKGINFKALVLGSTPEFRDLLSKYKVDTTFVDINSDSARAMTSLLKLPKNPREKFVLSDWLHMPFAKNSFDLVLSDSAQDNIKYSEFKPFFKNIFSILKPEGLWFFGAVNVKKKDLLTFEQYINLYKKSPEVFKDQRNYWFNFFRLCYNPEFYDKKTKTYNFKKVNNKIKELIKDGVLPKKAIKDIGFGLDYQQVLISEQDFKKIIKKYFKVADEYQDKSHLAMKIKWTAILKPTK